MEKIDIMTLADGHPYDEAGEYVGTVEVVQNHAAALQRFGKK